MKRIIRIGTRGSRLALAQAEGIRQRLAREFPQLTFVLEIVKTTGDEFQSVEIFKKTNIGVFTKAIEKKLIDRKIDIAIHSLKDLPTLLPKTLCLGAFPRRVNPQDALICKKRLSGLEGLPPGAGVGTGSPRRKRQLALLRPDLRLVDIRGNLDTRIQKVLSGELDAVVVAKAGLVRLKKYIQYASPIPPAQILPAVGQGALGIEVRKNDVFVKKIVRRLHHAQTEKAVVAERVFLHALQGGCRVPVGIYSRVQKNKIFLKAAVFSTKSNAHLAAQESGYLSAHKKIARRLAGRLLKMGASKFLNEARTDL